MPQIKGRINSAAVAEPPRTIWILTERGAMWMRRANFQEDMRAGMRIVIIRRRGNDVEIEVPDAANPVVRRADPYLDYSRQGWWINSNNIMEVNLEPLKEDATPIAVIRELLSIKDGKRYNYYTEDIRKRRYTITMVHAKRLLSAVKVG